MTHLRPRLSRAELAPPMSIEALCGKLPPHARDIAANLQALTQEGRLDSTQKWGAFLACAYALGEPETLKEIEDAAELTDDERAAAKSAATIEAMNNIYFRSIDRVSNPEYRTLPPGLRMSVLADPGVPKVEFELWSLAVSALGGCGPCMDSHEAELRHGGMDPLSMQAALRIAAVVKACATVLAAEAALKDGGSQKGGDDGAGDRAGDRG